MSTVVPIEVRNTVITEQTGTTVVVTNSVVNQGGGGSAEFPPGGEAGQALVKRSDADSDVEWATVKGEKGEPGKDGAPGKDGKDGATGPAGKDGAPGKDGTNGKDGAIGPAGPAGKDGTNGVDGKDGAPGAKGDPGKDGTNGTNGKDGAPGKDGATGPAGKDGAPGKDGAQGPAGPPGPAGSGGLPDNGENGQVLMYDGGNAKWVSPSYATRPVKTELNITSPNSCNDATIFSASLEKEDVIDGMTFSDAVEGQKILVELQFSADYDDSNLNAITQYFHFGPDLKFTDITISKGDFINRFGLIYNGSNDYFTCVAFMREEK